MYKRLKKIKKLLPLYIMALPALVYLFINNYLPLTGMVVTLKISKLQQKEFMEVIGQALEILFLFKNSVASLLPETQYCTMWHLL